MGKRSRKPRSTEGRRPSPAAPAASPSPSSPAPSAVRRGPARGEQRNEAIRRSLEPLAPGERPGAVTVAAVLAVVLGLVNVGMLVAGVEVGGEDPSVVGTIAFAVIMLIAAVAMWRGKYWAVLGFQALLALTIFVASIKLVFASSLAAAGVSLLIIALGGTLFWKLVRALARLQLPLRHEAR